MTRFFRLLGRAFLAGLMGVTSLASGATNRRSGDIVPDYSPEEVCGYESGGGFPPPENHKTA